MKTGFGSPVLREAIASVALSHRPDCGCDVCKAASGDWDALWRVIKAVRNEQDD